MHPRAIRQKQREANEEASELATSIANKTGVSPDILNAYHQEPAMNAMYQAEALRDFLKELDASLGSGPAATDLESVDGIGEELAGKLKEAGFHTVDDLKNANEEDLIAVDGVGKSKAAKLKDL